MNAPFSFPNIGESWPWGGTRCCAEDYGGSHYHCGNCGAVTGMYGHYVSVLSDEAAKRYGVPVGFEGFTCAANEVGVGS